MNLKSIGRDQRITKVITGHPGRVMNLQEHHPGAVETFHKPHGALPPKAAGHILFKSHVW